jgi:hypothetical protein
MSLAPIGDNLYLVWFVVGRIIFGLINRPNWRLFIYELLGVLIFLGFSLWICNPTPTLIEIGLIAAVFFATSIGSRMLAPHEPILKNGSENSKLLIEIIDFVWLAIMAGGLAAISFAKSNHPFTDISPKMASFDYLNAELSNTVFFLDKVIEGFFILGGILAGCMAILWAGEVWQKADEEGRRLFKFNTAGAVQMVIAFFVTIISVAYWIGIPLYQRMNNLTQLIKHIVK